MAAKIAIIGAGQVGAAAAYALLHGSLYGELLLVDVKLDLREGQVRDLSDASFCENSSTRIRSGTYKEAGQCDIVVITAGSRRTIGEQITRLETGKAEQGRRRDQNPINRAEQCRSSQHHQRNETVSQRHHLIDCFEPG